LTTGAPPKSKRPLIGNGIQKEKNDLSYFACAGAGPIRWEASSLHDARIEQVCEARPARITAIQQIVFVIKENRRFDNHFGGPTM
jgi:phospholipase C